MKINFPVLALLIFSSLPVGAQGVIHLSQGDSYLFSQPTYVRGQIDEAGRTSFVVQLGFTGDLFTVGESLQVDVLSMPTAVNPLATSIASNPPWTIENQINFSWTGSSWDTPNGAVRLTMLVGSVDVVSVLGITASQWRVSHLGAQRTLCLSHHETRRNHRQQGHDQRIIYRKLIFK